VSRYDEDETPRDPAEKMFPVLGSRFFLTHFAILLAQSIQARLADGQAGETKGSCVSV